MTQFRLNKQFFQRKGNYLKIDFVMSMDEMERAMVIIMENERDITSAEDFRDFVKDALMSKILKLEEGR